MNIYRSLILSFAVPFLASCAQTNYETYASRNNAPIHGQGGTSAVTDGMAIWDNGEPPRDFVILGIIDDERPGGLIPMAQLKSDMVKKAKEAGGDALVLIRSDSQIAGYYSSSTASAYATGNGAAGYGSTVAIPLRHHSSKFAVIKYVQ